MSELQHIGTETSGRYPKGSGDNPDQHDKTFMGQYTILKNQGLTDAEIARGLGMKKDEMVARRSMAKDEKRRADANQAWKLKEKGYSNIKIGEIMGRNESSVREMLKPYIQEKTSITDNLANLLRDQVNEHGYVDVGVGVERNIGNVSRDRVRTALTKLKDEGYEIHTYPQEQIGTGKNTTMKVLAKPGTTWSEAVHNYDKVVLPFGKYTEDGGRTMLGIEPPKNISSDRIKVAYTSDKDGVIELRRGVDELSLGNRNYAQVRIAVDGTHFLKGMAIYGVDMPKGVDIIYNTNKKSDVPKMDVFKKMERNKETGEIDTDNPFGSTIRQKHYIDANGNKQLSALNIVGSKTKEGSGEEGSWDTWSKTLSSQMMSKQPQALAKKQLGLAFDDKKREFDDIMALTNPVVKKKLLETFADGADSDAVHLKAAALPRQSNKVILPIPSLKDNEIYAPTYDNGEKVVLIRHPHGGKFEIPELTVNNNIADAKKMFPTKLIDAVGINPKVAERLSGADFDGDTVLVIPNRGRDGKPIVQTSPALKELENFDPKTLYKKYDGMPVMDSRTKGIKMGEISNLITDMTIKGASNEKLARAVRHSMVVIDAEKHELNYKQSYKDHDIASLRKEFQGSAISGASTIVSRAKSEYRVPKRIDGIETINPVTGKKKKIYIDPETGKKLYTKTGESYIKRTVRIEDPVTKKPKDVSIYKPLGKQALLDNPNLPIKETKVIKTIKSTKMYEYDDAFKLSSGTLMENTYAEHANKLKALANTARKESLSVPKMVYSPSANKAYAKEVASLKAKLNIALKNAPLERQAQRIARSTMAIKKAQNPNMEAGEIKKKEYQALVEARTRMTAGKDAIPITDREWEAIQAGAITTNTLTQILNNTKPELIKQLATPRHKEPLSSAKETRIRNLIKSGHTQAEIAREMGVSTTLVSQYMMS